MNDLLQLQKDNELLTNSIIEISNEAFRFRRVFMRAVSKLGSDDQNKYTSQFSWFSKKVDKAVENAGLKIIDLTGQLFDPGMAVTPLNIEDFDAEDQLYVEQMMEPIIMKDDKIRKTGTVMLGRIEE